MAKDERIEELISSWLEETARPNCHSACSKQLSSARVEAGSRLDGARSWRD